MIAFLRGNLDHKSSDSITIDVNGVGYRVYTSDSTLNSCMDLGAEIKVYTYFHVREDIQALYGFLSMDELKMFKQLISVSGVGPKAALSLVSFVSPPRFAMSVLTDDADTFTKAPGIGKKTAQRIILELKDKIKKEQKNMPELKYDAQKKTQQDDNQVSEAITALIMLGYSSLEAKNAVNTVYSSDKSVEQLIKDALKQMIT